MEVNVSHVGFGTSTRLALVPSLYMSLILFSFSDLFCLVLLFSRHDRSREFFLFVNDVVSMSPVFSFRSSPFCPTFALKAGPP